MNDCKSILHLNTKVKIYFPMIHCQTLDDGYKMLFFYVLNVCIYLNRIRQIYRTTKQLNMKNIVPVKHSFSYLDDVHPRKEVSECIA